MPSKDKSRDRSKDRKGAKAKEKERAAAKARAKKEKDRRKGSGKAERKGSHRADKPAAGPKSKGQWGAGGGAAAAAVPLPPPTAPCAADVAKVAATAEDKQRAERETKAMRDAAMKTYQEEVEKMLNDPKYRAALAAAQQQKASGPPADYPPLPMMRLTASRMSPAPAATQPGDYGTRLQPIVIVKSDMRHGMIRDIVRLADDAVELSGYDFSSVSRTLKERIDAAWGPHWHVAVGTRFSTSVTHLYGHFLYARLGEHIEAVVYKSKQ